MRPVSASFSRRAGALGASGSKAGGLSGGAGARGGAGPALETIFERNSVASDWESTGRASPRTDVVPADWDGPGPTASPPPVHTERSPSEPPTPAPPLARPRTAGVGLTPLRAAAGQARRCRTGTAWTRRRRAGRRQTR